MKIHDEMPKPQRSSGINWDKIAEIVANGQTVEFVAADGDFDLSKSQSFRMNAYNSLKKRGVASTTSLQNGSLFIGPPEQQDEEE